MTGRDLGKLAENLKEKVLEVPSSKIIEVSDLSLIEAKKLRDDYFANYPGFIGIQALNPDFPELSSYVACVRGGKYNA